jgi:hypothetical protein
MNHKHPNPGARERLLVHLLSLAVLAAGVGLAALILV